MKYQHGNLVMNEWVKALINRGCILRIFFDQGMCDYPAIFPPFYSIDEIFFSLKVFPCLAHCESNQIRFEKLCPLICKSFLVLQRWTIRVEISAHFSLYSLFFTYHLRQIMATIAFGVIKYNEIRFLKPRLVADWTCD